MVQNCQNITNPRGYNHGEQLVAKRLTLMMIQVSINVRLYLLSGSERLLFWEDGLAYIVTVFGYLGFGLNLYVDIGSKVIRC